jgi:hypothetical protein
MIQENLHATVTDTLISAFRTEGKDTVVDVRYFPRLWNGDVSGRRQYAEAVLGRYRTLNLAFIGF